MGTKTKKIQNTKISILKRWDIILLTEFLGTIALVLWIILPSAMAFSNPSAHTKNIEFWNGFSKIWELIFMKAFWVISFIIVIVYLLRYISVNLNPVVTIAEIAKKNDSVELGLMKISVQMFGGIIAGFIAADIAKSMNLIEPVDLDAVHPRLMMYDWTNINPDSFYNIINLENMKVPGMFLVFSAFLEFAFTFGLIGSIFYFPKISNKWRPLFLGIVIWIILCFGIRTNNIPLNPARLIGPALAHDVTSMFSEGLVTTESKMDWAVFYLIPEIAAAALFSAIERFKIKKK
ncbi:MAG: aquaporin [Mycoplasmataceae bacterium]|nr:aquaporin [Mycoplasmataceae bacterium]